MRKEKQERGWEGNRNKNMKESLTPSPSLFLRFLRLDRNKFSCLKIAASFSILPFSVLLLLLSNRHTSGKSTLHEFRIYKIFFLEERTWRRRCTSLTSALSNHVDEIQDSREKKGIRKKGNPLQWIRKQRNLYTKLITYRKDQITWLYSNVSNSRNARRTSCISRNSCTRSLRQ